MPTPWDQFQRATPDMGQQGGMPSVAADPGDLPTGDDYLKTLPSARADMVKGIAEGRIPYPTGFVLKTPYGQRLQSDISQYEPGLDTTTINRRRTFNTQLGSAAPSSVGGQKALMGTSLGHLAEVAEAARELHNVSGLGFAPVAHTLNALRGLGTEQAGKVNKLEETVDRFSGEVGKLYSGSQGGGVEERAQTRSRFGASLSPEELAGGLEASRDLIRSKLSALENQRDEIFGPDATNKIDFLGESGRNALTKIDKAIAELRGLKTGEPKPAVASPLKPGESTTVNGVTIKRLN